MEFSRSAFVVLGPKLRRVSRAQSLKTYRCVPDGGHGPPQFCFLKSFNPCIVPAGTEFSLISFVPGLMFHKTQCTHTPLGASGSSTIKASDFAFAGTFSIKRGGLISFPSQVYLSGMQPLFSKTGLDIVKPLYCSFSHLFYLLAYKLKFQNNLNKKKPQS